MSHDDEDIIDELFELEMMEKDENSSQSSKRCCFMTLVTFPLELLFNLFR